MNISFLAGKISKLKYGIMNLVCVNGLDMDILILSPGYLLILFNFLSFKFRLIKNLLYQLEMMDRFSSLRLLRRLEMPMLIEKLL